MGTNRMQFERNEFYANRKKRFEKRWRCPPKKKKKKYGSLTVDNREENKLEGWAKGFNTVECG